MTNLLHLLCVLALSYNDWSVLFAESKETSRHETFTEFRAFMTELTQKYDKFKRDYNRVYESAEEESKRFAAFMDNYIFVKQVNNLYEQGKYSYNVGINRFSDMTEDERTELKFNKSDRLFQERSLNPSSFDYGSDKRLSLPYSIDWRLYNFVTPVKDQVECGGCYAFSATGSLEGQHYRKTGLLISLSEQQIIDCSSPEGDHGCNGGQIYDAFEYIYKNNGIGTEASYPFISGRSLNSTCRFNNVSIAKIIGYANITPSGDEAMLERAVATVGPISVVIDATDEGFRQYTEGVYYHPMCKNNDDSLNHAVLVVGYGVESGVPYWLVKNSWGKEWGMDGYVKMRRNADNMCGIATSALFPIV